jgi:hypothetical protein
MLWYFYIAKFIPEVGFQFQFVSGNRSLKAFRGDRIFFDKKFYASGWTYIIGNSLREFLEQ